MIRRFGRPLSAMASMNSRRCAVPNDIASPVVPKRLMPSQPFSSSAR
jgi:hypothetical protein